MGAGSTSAAPAGLVGLESHLLDRVHAAVMAVDLDGRVLFANRFVEDLYGWAPAEVIGQMAADINDVVVTHDLRAEIMNALSTNGSWEGTFEIRRKDGSTISVHAVDTPLYDSSGKIIGVI